VSQSYNRYVDEYQNVHIQDQVIGRGGQGVVFRTKDPDLAIKLVTDENGNPATSESVLTKYTKRFNRVRLLPLPENINISVPAALIQNQPGYVMQLLSEMVPFSHFWLDGKSAEKISSEDIPEWLTGLKESEAKKLIHYCRTGGLKRRLIALYKCASVLARLHGSGFVYGDVSPNNIFLSEGTDDSTVWLIDADNIRFEITEGGSVVYTPKYGAPELVQNRDGGRPSTDVYAFAVVAFYLLSLIHPFIGKRVDGSGESDWAESELNEEDIEEKAYAGLLPWVDDDNDDSNGSNAGLPRSLLLTSKLSKLFARTFGPGRSKPWLRPSIYYWPEALAQAADLMITCPVCKMSYYFDHKNSEAEENSCPYCESPRPQLLLLKSFCWRAPQASLKQVSWQYVLEITENEKILIPRRVLTDFSMISSDNSELTLGISKQRIHLSRIEQKSDRFSVAVDSSTDGNFQNLMSQMKINRSKSEHQFWLFAQINTPRLISCSIVGGEE
jgi:serine/threonine protein kinase